MMKIIAHRGYRAKYTENTMTAFRKAIQSGADGLELDVHLSLDGELVVFHDEDFRRLAGREGLIKNMTYDEIKKIGLQRKLIRKERAPLLQEVLELVQDKELLLNIEIKAVTEGMLEERLVALLSRYSLRHVVISSFHPECIVRVKERAPEIETALLYSKYIDQPWLLQERFLFDAIHTDTNYTSKAYAELIQSYGLPVRIYTVNKERDLSYWLDSAVDAVITDEVELAVKMNKEK
ncbi:glycerophosphodiester phosphodiesterase [Macrococcus carouselicus]|uniref:Glycerophosphodiester phosphodiesterase n=2 Tax=Macrococcus carouselicus TaxID=69969 RepID=A0A9Q8CN54_9STAP|nr:glycerophosphodiester phosphodiesterase [Macrococcus carouselicus]